MAGICNLDEAVRVEREVSILLGCSSTTLRHRDSGIETRATQSRLVGGKFG